MRRILPFMMFALVLAACQGPKSGIDTSMMDTSVRPQDDFYEYMNGTWLRSFEIPADKSNYGSFTKLSDDAEANLRTIVEAAAKAPDRQPGSDQQKIGDLYASFMDTTRIEELGIGAIKEELDAIQALENKKALAEHAARLSRVGISGPFSEFVGQDAKNSTEYIVNLYQAGLSLPDRDYYLREDAKFAEFRTKLVAHMEKMFSLAGYDDAAGMAKRVFDLEMKIAKAHWARVDNRDPDKTYNKVALKDLGRTANGFDWQSYAAIAGFADQKYVRVYQPTYLKAFGSLFKTAGLQDWKDYFAWRLLTASAPYMSTSFAEEDFAFFSKTLRGVEEERPRWKRGISVVQRNLGFMLGKLYVEKHFPPQAKERMQQLVTNLREAFKERINGLEWMGEETKKKALAKLEKFNSKIGYPDKWRDYTSLGIKPDDLIENLRTSAEFETQRQLNKLGEPIDRTEWGMTPQTVNAYYSPTMNEVVFPAAILQPPFFNMAADDAVNYGGIGAVIGHELTHGFDDQGRKYDGEGNLSDWWTESDGTEFEKRAQVMIDQYGAYSPIDSLSVNGKLTLGENIADLGGLTIAYYAYQRSLDGKEAPVVDGFTGDQRFFLGWAQVWGRKYRDDELRNRLVTDPHSPSQYRTNGIVSNMPEFYAAFDVTEGDPMYRSDEIRVKIW